MAKEKLGILSSYDELCGNASYTKALVQEFSKHYDVTVVPLKVELLRKGESAAAQQHIKEVCQQLKTFDCVNIQFEAGLFGSSLPSILFRFLMIGQACKKLVLTMHRYHAKEKYPNIKMVVKSILNKKIKQRLDEFQFAYINNRYLPLYDKIIAYCVKRKAPILVHTKRECELIKIKFNYAQVYDHPLSFFDQDYIESIRKSSSRENFCKRYSLNPNKTYIGIFGFINRYKGHETAIQALEFLPKEYELLIFGAQHPHTITLEESINPYIASLVQLVKKLGLTDRVKFYGSLNDEDFLKALLFCDYNVLPYLEVNQGGSAVAALALETCANSIFSQNRAFLELSRYAPDAFKMFSIGNYLELAQAILSYGKSTYSAQINAFHTQYNIQTSVQLYRQLLSGEKILESHPEKSADLQPLTVS
ncbi:MAG: glycosyltransferase [Verrucomicrobia bacterium]|nr:glycosyltransferase [Verrucomicrobiota bacterium]